MPTETEAEHLRLQVRRVYQTTPALMHALDERGQIEMVSDAWLEHFGYERHEVVGRCSTDFLDEKSQKHAKEVAMPLFFAEGRISNVPLTWVCKDGTTRDTMLTATGEEDGEGNYIRSLAVLRDVTFLRAMEQRAERERAVLERVFWSASDAFLLAEPSTREIIRLNRAAEKLFRCTTAEVVGKSVGIFCPYAGRGEERPPGPTEYHRYDGTSFVGETVNDAILDSNGQITSCLAVIRDVTTDFESRAALERSNKKLEQSLEALDQFAYVASHDLRTPLRGIQHVVRFLEEDSPPEVLETIQTRLDQLRERTEWMDQMLEGLLRFARNGHLSVSSEDTNLAELLVSIDKTMQMDEASTRDFVLATDFSNLPGPVIQANTVAMRHVLSNLISNAVAHHDGDRAQVTVSCEQNADGWKLSVTDDGPGIEARHHERVFQIFRTLTPRGQGSSSGMGLALVRRLVDRVGGSVHLVSPVEDGRGCCFVVQLPKEAGA